MSQRLSSEALAARRSRVLKSARWCFLNFGFSRTSLEDIARRASISRTLLYKMFKDKEDIFIQVFDDWILSQHPLAMAAATGPGPARDRLLAVCQYILLDLWSEMEAAPMAEQFQQACEGIRPRVAERHRAGMQECIQHVLRDPDISLVFLMSLEGLVTDRPSLEALRRRVRILVDHFTGSSPARVRLGEPA